MAKHTELMIDECRKRFEAGEAKALLDAVDLCARGGIAMPLWTVDAFCSRYVAWATYRVKTLDEAFGVERKGERIPERRKRQHLKPAVAIEVDKLHRQGAPIAEALFEQIGEILDIGPGTARDIYYKDNPWRHFLELVPREPPSSILHLIRLHLIRLIRLKP